jgi:hypothetical protein
VNPGVNDSKRPRTKPTALGVMTACWRLQERRSVPRCSESREPRSTPAAP